MKTDLSRFVLRSVPAIGEIRLNLRPAIKLLLLGALCVGVASCSSGSRKSSSRAHINNKTKFSVKEFGVKASPRVTTSKRVRRGGGRAQVGKRYKVRGKWYYPREQPGYDKIGKASWYGPNFHGRLTANGEIYDQYSLSGAHPTFPLPSYARVTNLANGNSVVVRVNDRGPYAHGRVIDMSAKAAELLDYKHQGIAKVRVQYIGKARLDGRDQRFLVASFKPGRGHNSRRPNLPAGGVPGVLLAGSRPPASVGSLQALSFVRAPIPRERPVFTGGVPVVIGALQPTETLELQIENQLIERRSLDPISPSLKAEIKDGFTISSYAAGMRISNAHAAANEAIGADATEQRWKNPS